MPERLRQLGLDPEFLRRGDTAVYRDLERVCARCKASERSARDLAAGVVEAGMRSYCSNAHTINALICRFARTDVSDLNRKRGSWQGLAWPRTITGSMVP